MNDASTSTAGPTKPVADADLKAKPMNPNQSSSPAAPPVDGSTTYTQGNDAPHGATGGRPGDQPGEAARREASRASDRTMDEARRRMDEVRDFTRDASDKARQQWAEGREKFEHAKRELAHQWKQQKGAATERASRLADEQRQRALAGVTDVVSATRAAAQELRNRDDTTIAGYAEAAADQLECVQRYLEHAELNDLAREAASFTRRRPEWVLGGAFVAGLALARFLKADRPHRRGLPPGADESLWQDAVDQQHAGHHAMHGTTGPGVHTSSNVRTGVSVTTPGTTGEAMPAVPAFGETAPVGLSDPAPVPPPTPARGDHL